MFPPQRRINFPFEARIGRAVFAGNLDNYIDWFVYFFGSYETGMLAFIEHILPQLGERPVFWDVGANCGQHAVFAGGLGAQVEAFEPLPLVREKLERNAALNRTASISVHPYALGDSNGLAAFAPPDNENFGTGHIVDDGPVTISIKRGDDVNAAPPAIIKIDVEGHEGAVLRGLAKTVASHRPIIVCEFSAATKSRDDDLRAFMPEAYRCLLLAGVEAPYLMAYSGAGAGETLIMFPEEKAHLVHAACDHVSPATVA